MKVRCVRTMGYSLTVNKVYDVINIKNGTHYTIKNDNGIVHDYEIRLELFEEIKEKIIQNCEDCKFYIGEESCGIHHEKHLIYKMKNNSCRNYEKKEIVIEKMEEPKLFGSHVAKGVKKCYIPKEVTERTGHYKGTIEPFDVMKEMGIHTEFVKGNIIKYVMRAGKKQGQEKSDLKKILDYALELCLYSGIDTEEVKELVKDRVSYYEKTKRND